MVSQIHRHIHALWLIGNSGPWPTWVNQGLAKQWPPIILQPAPNSTQTYRVPTPHAETKTELLSDRQQQGHMEGYHPESGITVINITCHRHTSHIHNLPNLGITWVLNCYINRRQCRHSLSPLTKRLYCCEQDLALPQRCLFTVNQAKTPWCCPLCAFKQHSGIWVVTCNATSASSDTIPPCRLSLDTHCHNLCCGLTMEQQVPPILPL